MAINLHDKALLLNFFEIGCHPSRLWYARLLAKPRGRYQPFGANSRVSYKVGKWHSSPSLRRETIAAESSVLVKTTTSSCPDYDIQDIHGSVGCGSTLIFSRSPSTQPKRKPLQGIPRYEPPQDWRVGIFGESC